MRTIFVAFGAAAIGVLCACSGGGGSSSAPEPAASLGGAGTPAVFNQKITFTIEVPAAPPAASTSARRRRASEAVATPIATTPYISPQTGSVVLTLAAVNAVSPQQAPPAIPTIDVPPSCQGSSSGCTIPVANVPAALGIDRYFVQTYAGPNGTRALISTGFVDVTVPVKTNTNPSIGGAAALSIGGYVASITLAPASLYFVEGTPSDANILVQALDAGGATIVGAAQYATPVTVSIFGDTQNFALSGSASLTVPGPLQKPLTLHYGGGNSFGTLVEATSQNGSGVTVNASPIPANALPPGSSPPPAGGGRIPTPPPTALPTRPPTGLPTAVPTPVPTPTLRPTQAMSLYVADAQADTISEYRIASQIAAGITPDPAATPSRVIKFVATLAQSPLIGGGGLSCTNNGTPTGNGYGTAGVTVDPKSGTIFILPNCTAGSNGFVFGYPAGAVGSPVPTLYDPIPGGGFGVVNGLALANGTVYADYSADNNGIYGWPVQSNAQQPSIAVGTQCYAEFGNPSPGCFSPSTYGGFGVEGGFFYVPSYWNDSATGDAAAFTQPAAVLALIASGTNATATPYSAISGLYSTAGGSSGGPLAATVDGSTLYVLTGGTALTPAVSSRSQNTYWTGVSSCPPPSSNAPINALVTNSGTQCADMQQHLYLASYSLTGQLLGPSAYGNDIDLIPNFLVGGDVTGRFGCAPGSVAGQFLAASGGYVYVINLSPTCASGEVTIAPEIDVYNTNNISGSHTDIAPVFVLPLQSGYPLAIALGPSGSVTGGQALLRAPFARPARPSIRRRRTSGVSRP